MATATIGYDKEDPCDKLARLIGEKVIASVRERPELWTSDQKRIAHACIKQIAYGTYSDSARQHSDNNRVRYIYLGSEQNDILFCARFEVELEHPELVELMESIRLLHREVENISTLR